MSQEQIDAAELVQFFIDQGHKSMTSSVEENKDARYEWYDYDLDCSYHLMDGYAG